MVAFTVTAGKEDAIAHPGRCACVQSRNALGETSPAAGDGGVGSDIIICTAVVSIVDEPKGVGLTVSEINVPASPFTIRRQPVRIYLPGRW